MNTYQAINKAADHIERHPETFDFWNNTIPPDCGTPGCALGWIGFFLGMHHNGWSDSSQGRVPKVLGLGAVCGAAEFYSRMTYLTASDKWKGGWREKADPMECARGLRLYAEAYHASEKPPVWMSMLDREAQARLDSEPAYAEFRQKLVLEPIKEEEHGYIGV